MTEQEQLFEQVYRTYGPSLYRFCLLQMKNPADAEDVLQEVFCKRLYRAPSFSSSEMGVCTTSALPSAARPKTAGQVETHSPQPMQPS